MVVITATELIQSFLQDFNDEVEIRNEAGHCLGYFTPREMAEAQIYEQTESLFDSEEMERRAVNEHGRGKSLTEIMKSWKVLENSS